MSKARIRPRHVELKPKLRQKKSLAFKIARAIFIVVACTLILAGIAERIWHAYNFHFKH